MDSTSAHPDDLGMPLPGRQFWGFLVFFHLVFLCALMLTLFTHLGKAPSGRWQEVALTLMVLAQAALYLVFMALPTIFPAWQRLRWFRYLLAGATDRSSSYYAVALRAWCVYIGASVLLVLLESRINRAFEWTLIGYIGQISAMPLRFAIPMACAIIAGWMANRWGWAPLEHWSAGRWLEFLMSAAPIVAMVFFMGRMVLTSAERGKLILQLTAAKRDLEKARDTEVEIATLRERERLARDLHDNLGHCLVTLTVQLEAAQRLLEKDSARATSLLGELQKLTRSSMDDLRRSLAGLRAPGLGDRVLCEAIYEACAQMRSRSQTEISCTVSGPLEALPPAVSEGLWRVVQEGLTNVEKHAGATHVQVRLCIEPGEVTVSVKDDGNGLRWGADEPGHFGLRGLRERIEGLGGTFEARPLNGSGTELNARVPLIQAQA